MTHYLRTRNGETVVDCETWKRDGVEDLSILVSIREFFMLASEFSGPEMVAVVCCFDRLQELRGEWFESAQPSGKFQSARDFVSHRFKELSKKYNMCYVTD